jgi:hypothetical protein
MQNASRESDCYAGDNDSPPCMSNFSYVMLYFFEINEQCSPIQKGNNLKLIR